MPTNTLLGYEDLPGLLALMSGDEKHDPAALSTLDTLWVLYDRVLDVAPDRMDDPGRDRFLLSKGHGPQAYFAVLASKGYFDVETLSCFGSFASPLGYHPDRLLVPGVEISSGSLGHGLAIAVGLALGLKATGAGACSGSGGGSGPGAPPGAAARAGLVPRRTRVFCLVGDAELDEGSNHEAIAVAGRLGLDGLTAIVIDNDSSSYGGPGGVEERFVVEGWAAVRVPSHDHDTLERALGGPPHRRTPADRGTPVDRRTSPDRGTPTVVVVEATSKPNMWRTLGSTSAHAEVTEEGASDDQQP
jgi:transketolase